MKKFLSVLLALTLLFASSCAGEAENGSSEAPVPSKAPVSSKQGEFPPESLPDIGEYTGVKASYFYGEPLDEFRPSDEYGKLIPYKAGGKYGFLSSDGRIITSPCYPLLSVYPSYHGKEAVYVAYPADFYPDGVSWDEVSPPFSILLISADGSRCVALESEQPNVLLLSGPTADAIAVEKSGGMELYDLAGNLLAFLSGVFLDTDAAYTIFLVREGDVYRLYYTTYDDGSDGGYFSVCTFDGETQEVRRVRFDDTDAEYLFRVYACGLLLAGGEGKSFLADKDGHVLFAMPENTYYDDLAVCEDGSYIAAAVSWDAHIDYISADGELIDSVESPYDRYFNNADILLDQGEIHLYCGEGVMIYRLRDRSFSDLIGFEVTGEKGSFMLRRTDDGKEVALPDAADAWIKYTGEAYVLVAVTKVDEPYYVFYNAETLEPVSGPYVDGAEITVVEGAGETYFSCCKNGVVTVLNQVLEVVGTVPVAFAD